MKKAHNNDSMFEDYSDISDLANIRLPDPILLEFYRGLKDRELLLNSDIDESTLDFSMYIIRWNMEDRGVPVEIRKPIKIYINSLGGDTNVIMNLADVISASKTPVITIGMGNVLSAAGMLLMAGHKRYIFKSTTILIHDGYETVYGETAKVLDNLEYKKEFEALYRKYVVQHTNISERLMDENYRRDWFMLGEEAIKYGVADKIISSLDDLP